ncbi:FAD binding domain-containing protein [Melampsora americana]|nr:FAD binding domain-containing protein [Melampsora americana]
MKNDEIKTDVLIVGAGPAGLMASLCLRTFHFNVHHIDDRPEPTSAGRADGIQPRTLEVFRNIGSCGVIRQSITSAGSPPPPNSTCIQEKQAPEDETLLSLGLAKQLIGVGVKVYEVAFWDPTPTKALARTSKARSCPDFIDVQDRYTLLMHQGIIEREMMREISSRMIHNQHYSKTTGLGELTKGGIDRPSKFVSCQVLDDGGEYPVESIIERNGIQTKVLSKYLIGCDGARSAVRHSIGKDRVALVGSEIDACWGVMDCVVESDFPDLKLKCMVHSRHAGSIMVIPRERNLVRFYVQLKLEQAGGTRSQSNPQSQSQHVQREEATLEICQARARKIFEPYQLDFKYVDWFSVYQIGQRISNRYVIDQRIILGGDAVHTHSPKAGQGMNISMLDMYSLAWKLNLIEKGIGDRKLLIDSYEEERRGVAVELLAFDSKYSSLFSGKADDLDGGIEREKVADVDPELFIEMFKKNAYFTSGCGAFYKANALNLMASRDGWHLQAGARLLPGRVKRLHDGNPIRIEQAIPMDGTFRIHIFLGRGGQSKLSSIATRLDRSDSFLKRFSTTSQVSIFHNQKSNSIFGFLVIGLPGGAHDDWELVEIPQRFRELVGDHHLLTDDLPNSIPGTPTPSGPISIHQKFGVDESMGGIVVVRPDGVVGCLIDGIEDQSWDLVDTYFDRFLVANTSS